MRPVTLLPAFAIVRNSGQLSPGSGTQKPPASVAFGESLRLGCREKRGPESNRRIAVLQSSDPPPPVFTELHCARRQRVTVYLMRMALHRFAQTLLNRVREPAVVERRGVR